MATMLSQKLVEAQEANDTVRDFIRRFEVSKLLRSCRAQKVTSKNSCPALRRIFCPSFSCKKLESHKGFLRFLPFNLEQNLPTHHQT